MVHREVPATNVSKWMLTLTPLAATTMNLLLLFCRNSHGQTITTTTLSESNPFQNHQKVMIRRAEKMADNDQITQETQDFLNRLYSQAFERKHRQRLPSNRMLTSLRLGRQRRSYDNAQHRMSSFMMQGFGKRDWSTLRFGKRDWSTLMFGKRDWSTLRFGKKNTKRTKNGWGQHEWTMAKLRFGGKRNSKVVAAAMIPDNENWTSAFRFGKKRRAPVDTKLNDEIGGSDPSHMSKYLTGLMIGRRSSQNRAGALGLARRRPMIGKRDSSLMPMNKNYRALIISDMGRRRHRSDTNQDDISHYHPWMTVHTKRGFGSFGSLRFGGKRSSSAWTRGGSPRFGKRFNFGKSLRFGKRFGFGDSLRFGRRNTRPEKGSDVKLWKVILQSVGKRARSWRSNTLRFGRKRSTGRSTDINGDLKTPIEAEGAFPGPFFPIMAFPLSKRAAQWLILPEISRRQSRPVGGISLRGAGSGNTGDAGRKPFAVICPKITCGGFNWRPSR